MLHVRQVAAESGGPGYGLQVFQVTARVTDVGTDTNLGRDELQIFPCQSVRRLPRGPLSTAYECLRSMLIAAVKGL